jgi:hypothetical protein
MLLFVALVSTVGAFADDGSGSHLRVLLRTVQEWQANIGNHYQHTVDFPPLPKCANNLKSYMDSHFGVTGNHYRTAIRRAKADVIELESLNLNTTAHVKELEAARRKEATTIKNAENYKINLENNAAGVMLDCYTEAKESSDFYAANRAVLKGQQRATSVIAPVSGIGFVDQLLGHAITIRLQAYVVLHAQVFITSAIVMTDGFVSSQLTATGSPWRHLGNFMEKCVFRASNAFSAAGSEWESSMVSISAITEEKGVLNAMFRIWAAYGLVLMQYGLAIAYTVAPFMMLVFFIVTAVIMAPVVVWYYLGYVLVWMVWIRRFFWLSIVVPEIAKLSGSSSMRLSFSDMYIVSEKILFADSKGEGGFIAAIPIVVLLACTVSIIIFTAASLALTLLDIAGERWEGVEEKWAAALKRVEVAEADTKDKK